MTPKIAAIASRLLMTTQNLPYQESTIGSLTASKFRTSDLRSQGSHSFFALDLNEWSQLLTCFKVTLTNLCTDIAKLAIYIATFHLTFLLPHNFSFLIAHRKCSRARPIEIAEVVNYTRPRLWEIKWQSATIYVSKRRT